MQQRVRAVNHMASSSSTCFSNGEEEKPHQVPAGRGVVVSSCLYLKPSPDAERRSLDRDAVLRRIRHQKRMNQFKTALRQPLGRLHLGPVDGGVNKEAERDGRWLDADAFSSP